MSDVFSDTSVAEKFLADQSAPSPESTTSSERAPEASQGTQQEQSVDQAIVDLEKANKFMLGGREWTRDSINKLIEQEKQFQSMNKDYTSKTQNLSKDRESFESERKFYENLAWDLHKVKDNPTLAQEFVKVYPQKFHQYVEQFLGGQQTSTSAQSQQSQPPVDIKTLSRVEALEKRDEEREVAKNEQFIESTVSKLSEKYPLAAKLKETVMARAWRSMSEGVSVTEGVWEEIFQQVNSEVEGLLKAEYSTLVKKQTEANAKSSDVGAGGGAAGRAPVKFKRFSDLEKYAEEVSNG